MAQRRNLLETPTQTPNNPFRGGGTGEGGDILTPVTKQERTVFTPKTNTHNIRQGVADWSYEVGVASTVERPPVTITNFRARYVEAAKAELPKVGNGDP